jgi:hypothetical protein
MGARHMTEDTRCLIIADYLAGVPVPDIARQHGCHVTYPPILVRRAGYPLRRSGRCRRRMGKAQRAAWGRRKFAQYRQPAYWQEGGTLA